MTFTFTKPVSLAGKAYRGLESRMVRRVRRQPTDQRKDTPKKVDPKQGSGCRPVAHPRILTIPAVAFSGSCSGAYTVASQTSSGRLARVLPAAVAVEQQVASWATESNCGVERLTDDFSCHSFTEAPADDLACEHVDNDREVTSSRRLPRWLLLAPAAVREIGSASNATTELRHLLRALCMPVPNANAPL